MNYISHVIKSLEAQSAPLRNAIKNIWTFCLLTENIYMYFHEFFKQLTEEETNLISWTE